MKIVLQNSSLLFKSKALLNGKIVMPLAYTWVYDGILTGNSASSKSGVTTGNNVRIYDLTGLPTGTIINIPAGRASNVNNWNSSQLSTIRHYTVATASLSDHLVPNDSVVTRTDTAKYTVNDDNTIDFPSITISKEEGETVLLVCSDVEPILTIDVSNIVNSGSEELVPTDVMIDCMIDPDGSIIERSAHNNIYKYNVVSKSWYGIRAKHGRLSLTSGTRVAMLNENGDILSTVQSVIQHVNNGGWYLVYIPEGVKSILIQGSDSNLDGLNTSVVLQETEVVG